MTETPECPEPCPFCGSTEIIQRQVYDEDDWIVSCRSKLSECPMEIVVKDCYSEEQALEAWNRRASGAQTMTNDAEALARQFHETYERLAPSFGYETRRESAVAWDAVPEKNRALMIAVCRDLLASRSAFSGIPRTENGHRCGVRGFDGMQGDVCPACSRLSASAPSPEDKGSKRC